MVEFQLLSANLREVIKELGLGEETPVQTEAIPFILSGENVLLVSPTGSGKTEAALLPVFEKIRSSYPIAGIKVVYITPLRSLNRDMLRRIEAWASRLELSVEVRHGDTPQSVRRRQSLSPPDILITTPESLQAILVGSRLRSNLKELRHVIIDEIHQLAKDRRGSQLSFGLERLQQFAKQEIQRIGLSATVADPELIANFLCGPDRMCKIVDTNKINKSYDYTIELPKPVAEDEAEARDLFISSQTLARLRRIVDLVEGHERTLIFVNSRTVAEELGSRLEVLGMNVGVHHGSLPREERERVEVEFRSGEIKALVCTSTLELGIDIGSVDLVIQYMSSRQVSSLVQRVGRSGHSLSGCSEGIILSVSPEDALECKAISDKARLRSYEPLVVPKNPLDVLAHQIAGLLLEYYEVEISLALKIAQRSYSFRYLNKNDLLAVTRFMEKMGYLSISGEYLVRRSRCRTYYLQNLSTIRDERRYNVIDLSAQKKVGILGEEFMLLHAQVGVHFIIKGKAWQIESIQEDEVYVVPVQDLSAAVPGWDGEMIPIPESVASDVGSLRRRLEFPSKLLERTLEGMERFARESAISELEKQSETSRIPTDRRTVVESYKNYLIVHTSAGDRINATLGELFEERLLRMGGLIRNWWNDGYRILIELSSENYVLDELVGKMFIFDATVKGFIDAVLRKHFPFGYDMKFVAERFGALNRGRLLSGDALKELGIKFRFTPIYDETLREAFDTRVDVQGTVDFLEKCSCHEIEICAVRTEIPSPLAMYILSRNVDSEDYSQGSNTVESMRQTIAKEIVSIICLDCEELKEFQRVGELPDRPRCNKCGSLLIAPMFYSAKFGASALHKRKVHETLTKEESELISKLRRSADVVLSYGKNGIIAQSVYGVGPQMAGRVLSKMHDSEDAFYKDLLEAKLNFIKTKRYWN